MESIIGTESTTQSLFSEASFSSLGLSPELLHAVEQAGYTAPTQIQALAIPEVFKGGDLLLQARTGSGKTAAFALPVLQMLCGGSPAQPGRPAVLVLTPTRELAIQVAHAFSAYAQHVRPVAVAALVGGESIENQMKRLSRGVTVAVATPGRLQDLVDRSAVSFADIATLVLDEADKMLDLGFAEAIEAILLKMPQNRQTVLLSATFPAHIKELAARFMKTPSHIAINDEVPTVETIEQRAIEVNRENRGPLLRHLLKDPSWRSVLIFVASQKAATNVTAKLVRDGVSACAFHGDLLQAERSEILKAFKGGRFKVLVATDLAARGIDISSLSHVVNYDLPRSPVDYIHRIGRTGRAGQSGVAVSFIGLDDQAHFALIEKRANIAMPREQIAGFERVGVPTSKYKGPAIKGKGPSKKDKARAQARQKTANRPA